MFRDVCERLSVLMDETIACLYTRFTLPICFELMLREYTQSQNIEHSSLMIQLQMVYNGYRELLSAGDIINVRRVRAGSTTT